MPPKDVTFVYFNGRGRAEQIRWVLEQTGAKWNDKRIEQADWPALKAKTPTQSLPYIEVDGKVFGSSGAIAMYVAREFGLAGANNLEQGQVHMIWEVVQDAFNESVSFLFEADEAKKAEMEKKYNTVTLPNLLKFLAARLSGGRKWLVGDGMTMADIVVASLLELKQDVAKSHAPISDLVNRVMALPNIKKWIAKRPETPY